MTSELDFDPALFGFWPKAPVYGLLPQAEAGLEEIARLVILETKAEAVSPLDDLQDMLNGMTKELREQMQQFQRLRTLATEKAGIAGDEIDRKLIQADAKASIEAMSVIVRTLEKIDSLQRTIAHDRQIAADTAFDEASYNALIAEIDLRVERRASELYARWIADARAGDAHLGGAGPDSDTTPGAPRGSPDSQGWPAPAGKEIAQAENSRGAAEHAESEDREGHQHLGE